jgi:hypothetical protein
MRSGNVQVAGANLPSYDHEDGLDRYDDAGGLFDDGVWR